MDNHDHTFRNTDYSGAAIGEAHFNHCTFEGCNFSGSQWKESRFSDCVFNRCNLSLIQLEGCRLHNVRFVDCKIVGADFFKCDQTFLGLEFLKSMLLSCNFSDMKLDRTPFKESRIRECHFINTSLVSADFSECDLSGSIFHHSDLSKSRFLGAVRYAISPQINVVKGAKFSLPEAMALLDDLGIIIE